MKKIIEYFKQYHKKITPLDLEILVAHVFKKERSWVIANSNANLTNQQQKRLNGLIKKRTAGVPIAYLTGNKEFFGLNFLVNKHVLIPRPETELMVENALQSITNSTQPIILVDVGTGSGCIPIAIGKIFTPLNTPAGQSRVAGLFNRVKTFAIDISKSALKIAKKNAVKHKVKITFLHGNLLGPFLKRYRLHSTSNIIITANLPYLTQKQFLNEPTIKHEPKTALIADNKNGLSLYTKLLQQIKRTIDCGLWTIDRGQKVVILLEIDPTQSKLILSLIKKFLPFAKTEIIKDLAGKNRLVKINW